MKVCLQKTDNVYKKYKNKRYTNETLSIVSNSNKTGIYKKTDGKSYY